MQIDRQLTIIEWFTGREPGASPNSSGRLLLHPCGDPDWWLQDYVGGLDKLLDESKIPEISGKIRFVRTLVVRTPSGFMKPTAVTKPPVEKGS
jgi:hypothetical protein